MGITLALGSAVLRAEDPAVPPIPGATVSTGSGPLRLEEVIASVELHYPLLRAAELGRGVADGEVLATMGAFDLNLSGTTNNRPGSTFENYYHDIGLSQFSPQTGARYFGGYRLGFGDFPVYDGDLKTADGGEFRVGMAFPLLRGRPIDRRRADLQQATIERAAVEPGVQEKRVEYSLVASKIYWSWVAAGHRLHLAKHLLDLAKERDAQLAERVRQGATSELERIDNQQNIALREGTLISAQNSFQQSSIDLSLFLRNAGGVPLIAQLDRVPTFPPPDAPNADEFAQALEMALNQRPEIQSLLLEREGLMVELRYAENLAEPGLDVVASAAQDVGDTSTSTGLLRTDRSKFDLGLRLEWPLQQRAALGKIQVTRHKLAQVEERLRYATDTVRAELQAAWTGLERSVEFYRQAKARVDLARRVADAERARLAGGQSTVLTVTLREQATFEAEVTAVGALYDYFTALAEYRAALGLGGPLPETRLIAPVVE